MPDRTLVLLKPDAVERGLVGTILARFEAKGLTIVAMDLRTLDADTLARHYEEHVGKGVLRRPRGVHEPRARSSPWSSRARRTRGRSSARMMGATNPRKAAPGTIRGDLGILFTENLVHGTDSLASAEREITSSSRICNIRDHEQPWTRPRPRRSATWPATTRSASA